MGYATGHIRRITARNGYPLSKDSSQPRPDSVASDRLLTSTYRYWVTLIRPV